MLCFHWDQHLSLSLSLSFSPLQLHWKKLLERIFQDSFSEDEEIVVLATDYLQKVSEIIKTTSKRCVCVCVCCHRRALSGPGDSPAGSVQQQPRRGVGDPAQACDQQGALRATTPQQDGGVEPRPHHAETERQRQRQRERERQSLHIAFSRSSGSHSFLFSWIFDCRLTVGFDRLRN